MFKKILKYLALFIFLVSVFVIVLLQFNSGQNINSLIHSNTRLLNELKTQRELQVLETEIISVESNVRGSIITERPDHLRNVEEEFKNIRSGLTKLDIYLEDPSTDSILNLLTRVVERKINHSEAIIRQYQLFGKDSAEKYINQHRENQ